MLITCQLGVLLICCLFMLLTLDIASFGWLAGLLAKRFVFFAQEEEAERRKVRAEGWGSTGRGRRDESELRTDCRRQHMMR